MYNTINGWTKAKMLEHISQNFKGKSVNDDGLCVYRGNNGTKCAVGLFIPDEIYTKRMDSDKGMSAIQLSRFYPDVANHMPLGLQEMHYLQLVHDNSNPANTKESLINWVNTYVKD